MWKVSYIYYKGVSYLPRNFFLCTTCISLYYKGLSYVAYVRWTLMVTLASNWREKCYLKCGTRDTGFLLVGQAANYPGTFLAIYQPQKTRKVPRVHTPFQPPQIYIKGKPPCFIISAPWGRKTAYRLGKAQTKPKRTRKAGTGPFHCPQRSNESEKAKNDAKRR